MLDNFGKQYTAITVLTLLYIGLVSEIVSFVLEKGKSGSDGFISKSSLSFTSNTIIYIICADTSVAVGEEVFQHCFCLLQYIAANNLSVRLNVFIS